MGANVVREDGTRDLDEYAIKEVDGIKIGIFGLSTEETKYKSNPKNTEGVNITDPIAKAEEMVKKLEEEKVDMIIALTHIGIDDESSPKSSDIAEKVEGIDLIVDGHSHSMLEEGKVIGDTLLVQTGEHLKNIGVVDVEFVDGKIKNKVARLVTFEEAATLAEDEEVSNAMNELEKKNEEITSVTVGKTKVDLVGEREVVRTGESNLGNLATDAMLDITGADVALTNGGGIRASIEPGDITKGDILEVFLWKLYSSEGSKGNRYIECLRAWGCLSRTSRKVPHVAGMTIK